MQFTLSHWTDSSNEMVSNKILSNEHLIKSEFNEIIIYY